MPSRLRAAARLRSSSSAAASAGVGAAAGSTVWSLTTTSCPGRSRHVRSGHHQAESRRDRARRTIRRSCRGTSRRSGRRAPTTSSSSVETTITATPASRSRRCACGRTRSTRRRGRAWAGRRQSRSSRHSSRASTTFCWLPPESVPSGVLGSPWCGCRTPRPSRRRTASMRRGRREPRRGRTARRWERSSMRFSAIVNSPTRPSSCGPRARNPTPRPISASMTAPRESSTLEGDRPGLDRLEAEDRLGELGLAVALHAGDGSTSPARTVKVTSSTRPVPVGSMTREVARPRGPRRPARAAPSRRRARPARPTISEASSALDAVGLASPTTLPSRITVMRSATSRTSRSLWVMKTMTVPASAAAA